MFVYGYLKNGYYVACFIFSHNIQEAKNTLFDIGKYERKEIYEKKPHFFSTFHGLENVDLEKVLTQ